MAHRALRSLNADLIECRRCPRLVDWREQTASGKRAAFQHEDYWGRPVPGFGDPDAELLVIGLAPAAHGANRTGRMFTGDRSGDWLFRALHRAGFASTPDSVGHDDGLRLTNAYITAPVRCAPPANRPTPEERDNCSSWFDDELRMLSDVRVVVCLGQYAYAATSAALARSGNEVPRPRPKFGHGVEVSSNGGPRMLLSFHPSQQNTFTGKLTEPMLDAVFARARGLTNRR
jgi:uracil-DNA glycosylase family 4